MDTWYDHFIEKVPGVQGGEPIIVGTRTPVRTIIQMYQTAYPGDLTEIGHALPHLTRRQIRAALAYYRDHPVEIEAHIERHRVVQNNLQVS